MKLNFTSFKKIFIFLLLIILQGGEGYAQKSKIKNDKSAVIIRSSDQIETYKNDPDFIYSENAEAPSSLWEKITRFISKVLSKIFSNTGAIPYIRNIILFIIAVFVVIKLFGLDYQTIFLRNRQLKSIVDTETYSEDIHEMDFDKLIKEAETNGNFRLAVRYLYLKLLKQLSIKEIIDWKIEKTNKDYRNEVAKTEHIKPFKRLTFLYEHLWYGDFNLDNSKYMQTLNDFENLFKNL